MYCEELHVPEAGKRIRYQDKNYARCFKIKPKSCMQVNLRLFQTFRMMPERIMHVSGLSQSESGLGP